MNGSPLYAIAAGGIFLVCFLVQARTTLTKWAKPMSVLFSQHLALSVLLHRHRTVGPWTRLGFLTHVAYIAVNSTVVFFRPHSLAETGRRAGELALVNLMYPLAAAHLGSLADHLGISRRACCQIHRATGWMSIALLSFHIIVEVQRDGFTFPLDLTHNLFTLIVCPSPTIMSTKLTPIGHRFNWLPCASFPRPHSPMVVRNLSSRPSANDRDLHLRDLATPS